MWNRKNDNIFWRDKCTYVISKGPVWQFPGFLVCLVNTVVTFSIYKNAHPSNFKPPVGRGIERESHMLEYISTHAHCTLFSQRKNSGAIQGHHGPLVLNIQLLYMTYYLLKIFAKRIYKQDLISRLSKLIYIVIIIVFRYYILISIYKFWHSFIFLVLTLSSNK